MATVATEYPDEVVSELARLFCEHEAWRKAAELIAEGATSNVYFSHRRGEPWHLIRRNRVSDLEPGAAPDPDFVFRFTPESVRRLGGLSGGIPEFALELFSLFDSTDEDARIDFRVAAPLGDLKRNGYVRLLLSAGPKVAAYAARHGLLRWASLKRLVNVSRAAAPFRWEC